MANLVVHIYDISQREDRLFMGVTIATDAGLQAIADLDIAVSLFASPPSAINSAIADAAEALILADYGIIVEPGERVLVMGGVV